MCEENKVGFWNKFKQIAKSEVFAQLDPENVYQKLILLSIAPKEAYFNYTYEDGARCFMERFCNKGFDTVNTDMNSILGRPISEDEVLFVISKLKKGKSPGIDRLLAELILASKYILVPHLTFLYNYILDNGNYPQTWVDSLRVAIPKDNGSDIQSITITPIFGKLLEMILDNHMIYLEGAFQTGDKFNGGFIKL